MDKIDYDVIEKTVLPDTHLVAFSDDKFLDIQIDSKYKYKPTNIFVKATMVLFRGILQVAIPFILFFHHGIIIKGRRNIKDLKNGAISITNHVLNFDSFVVAQCLFPRKIVIHSSEINFRVANVRHLMRLTGCIPIPLNPVAKLNYIRATGTFLQEGKINHICPEGALWPYYTKIRPFKPGAFHFAVKFNAPIIPIAINFRQARGIVKHLKISDRLVTAHIGKPLFPNKSLPFKEGVDELCGRAYKNIERMNRFYKWLDNDNFNKQKVYDDNII